jgi:hypothetical protein
MEGAPGIWAFSADAEVPKVLPLAPFPGTMSLPRGGALGAGTNLKMVAYRLHKFESGQGPGRLHGWIGRDATAETRDQTRSSRCWRNGQSTDSSRGGICQSDQ